MKEIKKIVLKFYSARYFLNEFYKLKKEKGRGWSYKVWSKQLNIKDPSILRKVCKGSRALTPSLCRKLSLYFSFNLKEDKHFQAIVAYDDFQRRFPQFSSALISSIGKEAYDNEYFELHPEQFTSMNRWWDYSLRCLSHEYPLKNNFANISKALIVPVTPEELKQSASRMLQNGLLKEKDGYLQRSEGNTHVSDKTIQKNELKELHLEFLDVAKAVVQKDGSEKYPWHTNNHTMAMESKNIKEMSNEMIKAIRDVLGKFENKAGDVLIQYQTQTFVIADLNILKNDLSSIEN